MSIIPFSISNDIVMTTIYDHTGESSGNLTLTCLAESPSNQTGFSYRWYHDGRALTPGMPNTTTDNNMLHVSWGVRGSIQCVATNGAGIVSTNVNLSESF